MQIPRSELIRKFAPCKFNTLPFKGRKKAKQIPNAKANASRLIKFAVFRSQPDATGSLSLDV